MVIPYIWVTHLPMRIEHIGLNSMYLEANYNCMRQTDLSWSEVLVIVRINIITSSLIIDRNEPESHCRLNVVHTA